MKNSGNQTPKISEMDLNKNNLNAHLPSPKNSIKRRKSFLPIGVLNLCKVNNENLNKKGYSSLKKQIKKGMSIESIPEEIENNKINKKEKSAKNNSRKNSKFKEHQNNYFINLIKNVYTNESHLNKDNIIRKSQQFNEELKKQYISNKDLFDKRFSSNLLNFNLLSLSSNKIKNQENHEKDKLAINSNLKVPSSNHKFINNINHYLDKNNLSKKEKKSIINYLEKSKEVSPTPKHKLNEVHSKTYKSKKRKKKKKINNNEELQIQNKNTENEINESNKNNNIIKNNIIPLQPEKINYFKAFLCCLKSN